MNRLERIAATTVVAAATVTGITVTMHHEGWRDEVSVWLVARNTTTLREALTTIGYIGHPKAYYALVWSLWHAFSSPSVIAGANLLAALVAIGLFVWFSPFSLVERALFAFGFYPLYQYGAVARPYAYFVLFLFAYAATRTRAPARVGTRFVLLAALAQTHALATIAAGVLFSIDVVKSDLRKWKRGTWLGVLVLAASGLAAAWQLAPPAHWLVGAPAGHRQPIAVPNWTKAIAQGFFPIFAHRGPTHLEFIGGLCLFAVAAVIALRHRETRPWFVVLVSSLFAFNYFVYVGYRWHHGFYFLFFVVALWLGGLRKNRLESVYVTALFALHAAVGLLSIVEDVRYPYSNGPAVAQWIRDRGLERVPLVGLMLDRRTFAFTIDGLQPVLGALDDARAYDPREGTLERYWHHYEDSSYFADTPRSKLKAELDRVGKRLGGPFLVVVLLFRADTPLGRLPPLEPLYEAPPALDFGEHYALCEYRPYRPIIAR